METFSSASSLSLTHEDADGFYSYLNRMRLGATGKLDAYDATRIYGGHAVCIVGYRTDGSFIVRNSWNTTWGDKGFAYVTPAYIASAFYPESYGAVVA